MSDFLRAEIKYGQANIPCYNILTAVRLGTNTNEGMAERLFYAAFNSYMSLTGDSTKLLSVRLVDLDGSAESTFTNPGNTTQNPNASDLPINNAFVVSKSFAGTVKKGRMFIPGVPEGSVNAGKSVLGTVVADLQEQMDNFLAICTLNQLADGTPANQPGEDLGLAGPPKVDAGTGNTFAYPILQFVARDFIGSQSRRRDNA